MLASILSSIAGLAVVTQALDVSVASSGGNASAPLAYGIMFEDINHSGDGGIYAELIRNRALQGSTVHPSSLVGWSAVGGSQISLRNLSTPLSSSLPTSLNVATGGATGQVGVSNTGWWGFDVKQQDYAGSFYVYGTYNGSFTASLSSYLTNETFGSATIAAGSGTTQDNGWTQFSYTLTPTTDASNPNNTFTLTFDAACASDGSLNLGLVSLFPPTYNNRPNGNRIELMQDLKGLNPSFLRLPGGNNLEGQDPPYLWYWNQTIGPLTDRPGRPGTWGYENTDGQGLIEYINWCTDLGMEPILAVWGGEYLDGTIISNSSIQTYVQYALDELEFLMGDASTTYGAQRIALGYTDPFPIKYVEVGNEDNLNGGTSSYQSYRFPAFYNAIKAAYPDIDVIASTVAITLPGLASGDYHEYSRPDNFAEQFGYFDHQDRTHKVLVGEFAVVQPNAQGQSGANFSQPRAPWPTWIGAVGEAVFLLGTERNSDAMIGASYAPLLQNLNSYEWAPDLISFSADPSQTILSTSYHVIQLLSNTRINETLPLNNPSFGPAYYVAGNTATGAKVLKTAVYNSTSDVPMSVSFDGVGAGANGTLTVLSSSAGGLASNTPGNVNVVQTTTTTITASDNGTFAFSLPDLSVSILEVDAPMASYKRSSRIVKRS